MDHYWDCTRIRAVRGFLALLCLAALIDFTVAQETEWFREIGLDLSVDPLEVISDAGGLGDVNLDGSMFSPVQEDA